MSDSSETQPKPELGRAEMADDGEQVTNNDDAYLETPELPTVRWILVGISLCMGLFMAMIDSSIVATSLYKIGADFQGFEKVNWVALAYTLSYLGFAVLAARISDVVGRRAAFMASFILFTAFSIGCALADTLDRLIIFRALQGLGGSGLFSLTMIVYPEITPMRRKKLIAAVVGLVIAVAGALGPILGGVLSEKASWHWVFWINVPVCSAAMILLFLVWPDQKYLPHNLRHKWKDLDFVGAFLVIAAAVLFVFAFQYTGDQQLESPEKGSTWGTASFIAPVVIAVFCWVALIAWERFFVEEKRWLGRNRNLLSSFPLVLFRSRAFLSGMLNTALIGFPYFTIIFAFPLRLQVVNEMSPLDAGIRLLPLLGGAAVGSSVSGAINGKKDWICETILVSSCLMLVGCALLTTVDSNPELQASAYGYLVLCGLGFGFTATAATMLVILESPIRHIAPAQGILAQLRILGGSVGIAMSTMILGIKSRGLVDDGILTKEQLSYLQLNAGEAMALLDEETQQKTREVFGDVLTTSMYACIGVSGAAIVAAMGIFRPWKSRMTLAEQTEYREKEQAEYRSNQKNNGNS